MQSFIVLASLVLELVGGQNEPPPLGTNVAKNPLGLQGLREKIDSSLGLKFSRNTATAVLTSSHYPIVEQIINQIQAG